MGTATKDFYTHHRCQTPIFREMPKELLGFAREGRYDLVLDRPYLLDLLEFEWVELEMYQMVDAEIMPYRQTGALLDDPLYLNPEHRILFLNTLCLPI